MERRRGLRRRALRLGSLAAILHLGALGLLASGQGDAGAALLAIAIVPWCLATAAYAKSKGYSRAWGWAGFMAPISLLGIALLPERPVAMAPEPFSGDYPRPEENR